jgi:hypothetical protein
MDILLTNVSNSSQDGLFNILIKIYLSGVSTNNIKNQISNQQLY